MIPALIPENEEERIACLKAYEVLDTEAEDVFDQLTQLASYICNTPISLVSLVDTDRQWFKSKVGLDAIETPRDLAFCAHAILDNKIFIVADSSKDNRFNDNPLAIDAPNVRFYAGMPLISPDGMNVGTLCVIDNIPRELDDEQLEALRKLAHQVVSQLELRKTMKQLKRVMDKEHKFKLDLQKKNKELDEFSYIISHDLKAPLRAINNLSEWIEDDLSEMELGEDTKANFNTLRSRVKRMESLINGVLQYSREGRMNMEAVDLDLSTLLQEIWNSLEKKTGLEFKVAKEFPKVNAPAILFTQIFENLIGNSIKYFDKEKGTIEVSFKDLGEEYEFSVKDDGPGIEPQHQKKIFQIFHTLTSKDEIESTGIGLAIVKKIIDNQGSNIHVESDGKAGSTFVFTWPKEFKSINGIAA